MRYENYPSVGNARTVYLVMMHSSMSNLAQRKRANISSNISFYSTAQILVPPVVVGDKGKLGGDGGSHPGDEFARPERELNNISCLFPRCINCRPVDKSGVDGIFPPGANALDVEGS